MAWSFSKDFLDNALHARTYAGTSAPNPMGPSTPNTEYTPKAVVTIPSIETYIPHMLVLWTLRERIYLDTKSM